MPRKRDENEVLSRIIGPRRKSGVSVLAARKSKKCTDLSDLTTAEVEWAKMYSATLKASGWSWRYISDTVNIQTSIVKEWADDPAWQAMLEKVAGDIVDGAIEHLNRHMIDLMEMLLELARTATDEAVKLRAIESGLDRGGLSKVNKSESKVVTGTQHDLSDDFFSKLEALPLDTQKRVAELTAELDTLVSEARGTE